MLVGAYGKVYKGILHEECNGNISETTVAIKSIASGNQHD